MRSGELVNVTSDSQLRGEPPVVHRAGHAEESGGVEGPQRPHVAEGDSPPCRPDVRSAARRRPLGARRSWCSRWPVRSRPGTARSPADATWAASESHSAPSPSRRTGATSGRGTPVVSDSSKTWTTVKPRSTAGRSPKSEAWAVPSRRGGFPISRGVGSSGRAPCGADVRRRPRRPPPRPGAPPRGRRPCRR